MRTRRMRDFPAAVLAAFAVVLSASGAMAQGAAPHTVMIFQQPVYQTGGVEFISNGTFESDLTGWTVGSNATIETVFPHTGSKCLRVGPGEGSVHRTVSLPAIPLVESATLTFWYRASPKSLAPVLCMIRDTATQTELISPFSTTIAAGVWTRVTLDVSTFLGRQIDVVFRSRTVQIGPTTQESTLWLDSVSLKTNESVYVNPMTDLYLTARDVQSNLDYTQWRHGTSGLFTEYTEAFHVPVAGAVDRVVQYRSVDKSFAYEPIVERPLKVVSYPPTSLLRFSQPYRVAGGSVIDEAGFENTYDGYDKSGAGDALFWPLLKKEGNYSLLLRQGTVSMSKTVTIPANADRALLSIWYNYGQGTSGNGYIWVKAPLSGQTVMLRNLTATADGWTEILLDVTSWKPNGLTLTFGVTNPSGDTSLFVDSIRFLSNPTVYVTPATGIDMISGSPIPLSAMEVSVAGGEWFSAAFDPFTVTGSGLTPIAYAATDAMGWSEHYPAGTQTGVFVDGEGPAAAIAINDGAPATETTAVELNIVAADVNNVDGMRIRNSTGLWGEWESFAQSKNWDIEGGGPGPRTVIAQFRDLLGNVTEVSDSIDLISPQPFSSIGEAKLGGVYPLAVSLTGRKITGVFPAAQCAYIQDPDRASGIKVNGSYTGLGGMLPGATLQASGSLRLDASGEPEIFLTGLTVSGPVTAPVPLALKQRWLGGGEFGPEIPGVEDGRGLHNVGQFVRTAGRVISRDLAKNRFVLNDGSATSPDGIWVELNGVPMPVEGAYVILTGDLGCVSVDSKTLPMIRLRSPADLASP